MSGAPFGFSRLWPVVPAAPDDEATPVGLAPGQPPVDPRRDGSRQPTAADAALSRAIGATLARAGEGVGAAVDAFTKPPAGPPPPALPFSFTPAAAPQDPWETPAGLAPGQPPVDPRRDGMVQPNTLGRAMQHAVGVKAGQVAQGLLDVASLPGDVNAGRTDPLSDEGVRRAFDLAGSLATGGMPMAQAGAAGIFGGRLAATADREALKRAEGMAAGGADRRAIWDDTGWFQGPDKGWRFEIPDNAATYAPQGATRVGEALAHPGLAQAYPDVAGLAFRQDDLLSRGANGAFSPTRGVAVDRTLGAIEGRPPVLHEAQHAVQRAEGFTGGANPRQFTQDAYADDLLSRWVQGAEPAADDIAQSAFQRWQQDQYRRTAGEVEARNVAARRDMTPEERRATPPWETQDVPDARQIVPGQPATGEQLAASGGPIRAFHGSPHDFDRFDVSRIGTGEGNQGFGRGLYFAGDERIARSYRDDLSKVPVLKFDGDAAGLNLSSPQNARDLAAFGFSTANGHLDAGLNNIRMMADFDPRLAPFAEEAAQHLRDGRVAMGPKSPGHMYEVAIDADPARLLDWDTPLAGQSPAVRSFAGDRLADPQARAAIETVARQRLGGPAEVTGHDLYRGLTGYDDAAKAAVSADMQAASIPGVQYMDTGSRGFGGGSQTRQYVTFGDDLVSVVRKYAAPGAVGAGGAAAALAPGDAQAAPSSPTPPAIPFGPVPTAWTSGNLSDRIVGAESGGNATAKNPRSSATGAGQFIDGTWVDMVRRYRPDLAGLPRDQVLALRNDAGLSREMVGHYADENGAKLRSAGLPDTDGTRYLAHFAGPAGARAVLSADPSTPAAQVLQPGQVAANPFVRNMTAGQLADWAARKVGSDAPTMRMPGGSSAPGAFGLSGPTQGRAPFSMAPAGGAAMTMPVDNASEGPGIASLLRVLMEEPAAAPQAQAAPAPAPTSAPFGFAPLAAPAPPTPRPVPFDYEKFVSLLRPRRPTR